MKSVLKVVFVLISYSSIGLPAAGASDYTDQQGYYGFESEVTDCGIVQEKKWKCPYCCHWWLIGQKCQNPDCPTNKW